MAGRFDIFLSKVGIERCGEFKTINTDWGQLAEYIREQKVDRCLTFQIWIPKQSVLTRPKLDLEYVNLGFQF